MSDITIVKANSEHVDGIMSIYKKELYKTPNEILIRYYIDHYPSVVALCEDKVIGFIYCDEFAPDIIQPLNFLVDSSYRRQHVGLDLVNCLARQLENTDYKKVIIVNSLLYVESSNYSLIVRRFYDELGFEVLLETDYSQVFGLSL